MQIFLLYKLLYITKLIMYIIPVIRTLNVEFSILTYGYFPDKLS